MGPPRKKIHICVGSKTCLWFSLHHTIFRLVLVTLCVFFTLIISLKHCWGGWTYILPFEERAYSSLTRPRISSQRHTTLNAILRNRVSLRMNLKGVCFKGSAPSTMQNYCTATTASASANQKQRLAGTCQPGRCFNCWAWRVNRRLRITAIINPAQHTGRAHG